MPRTLRSAQGHSERRSRRGCEDPREGRRRCQRRDTARLVSYRPFATSLGPKRDPSHLDKIAQFLRILSTSPILPLLLSHRLDLVLPTPNLALPRGLVDGNGEALEDEAGEAVAEGCVVCFYVIWGHVGVCLRRLLLGGGSTGRCMLRGAWVQGGHESSVQI